MNIKEIKIDFDDKNRSRLEARTYERDITEVPNTALPAAFLENLALVYKALTGQDIDESKPIYTIQSNSGIFKKLYTPHIYTEDNSLILAFGSSHSPILLGDLGIEPSFPGVKFSFVETQVNGYNTLCLKVTVTKKSEIIICPIPVRTKDFKKPPSADTLEILLSTGQKEQFFSLIGGKPAAGDNNFLKGSLVNLGLLPLGKYVVTESQWNSKGSFPSLHLQTTTEGVFSAVVPILNEDKTFSKVEKEITGSFRVKANSKLKKFVNSSPKYPFIFEVTGHGEYNGYPTASINIEAISGFEIEDEDDINLGF